VASVWVRERLHTGQTMSQVMAAFRERFNKAPPYTYVSDSNQFMVAYWSVYGDFSATLYIYIYIYVCVCVCVCVPKQF
jgi:hypothetical protein